MPLKRLDKVLTDRGLARSREEAKTLIEDGKVTVSGITSVKPSSMVDASANVAVGGQKEEWVSRGAYKLLRAIEVFGLDLSGLYCVDIGASTGGFTQVLLKKGASGVLAVDVGYGQLSWTLRNDPRVTVMERTNARYLGIEDLKQPADIITVDASFISLRLLLPVLQGLLADGGIIIALLKPQFEVGRQKISKGVVRDPKLHGEVIKGLADFTDSALDLVLSDINWSPVKGPEGNIEFLLMLTRPDASKETKKTYTEADIEGIVELAHKNLS